MVVKKRILFTSLLLLSAACSHIKKSTPPMKPVIKQSQFKLCKNKDPRMYLNKKNKCVFKDFLVYCQSASERPGVVNLISFLKNEVGTQNCEMAYQKLQKIRSLFLIGYKIRDIYPLLSLRQLTKLVLKDNKITDIRPISQMPNLQVLRLENNQIQSIAALGHLKSLTHLMLDNNKIRDIRALKGLRRLQHLNLNGNQVQNLQPLASLRQLKALGLRENGITDLSPLVHLKALKTLDLRDNPIAKKGFFRSDENCPRGLGRPKLLNQFCRQ